MASPGSRLTRFPLSAAIDLHETHLAPQSSLQVPVGHIPVPGGVKLCSPGTFWVANYLIINNSSCQVNFTKPNSSTIRYTHSQWLPEDATEALVGKVAVKNPVVNPTLTRQQYRFPSLRHATVPQKYLWAGSPCRRPVRRTLCHAGLALEHLWAGSPCRRQVRRTLRHAGMALEYLWAGSPCRRPVRRTLCHAGMPPRHLWAGWPCRSPVRSPLRHAGMALEYLWAGSPCRADCETDHNG